MQEIFDALKERMGVSAGGTKRRKGAGLFISPDEALAQAQKNLQEETPPGEIVGASDPGFHPAPGPAVAPLLPAPGLQFFQPLLLPRDLVLPVPWLRDRVADPRASDTPPSLEQWAQSLDPSDPARAAVEDFQLARAARKKKGGKPKTAAAGAQIERAVRAGGRLTAAERKLRKAADCIRRRNAKCISLSRRRPARFCSAGKSPHQ